MLLGIDGRLTGACGPPCLTGEVLEEDEYQRRKEYYMSVGQRHYYFMNIGNGEVIDACRKVRSRTGWCTCRRM